MTSPATTSSQPAATPAAGKSASTSRTKKPYPKYVVTWYFTVTIEDGRGQRKSLGNWASCGGLGLAIKAEPQASGGIYDEPAYLPGDITYGPITLERAMDRKSSLIVQQWVKEVSDEWVNYDGTGKDYEGSTVKITLYDSADKAAMSWNLRNAIPTKWTGPTLKATDTNVAIEKLELTHHGLEPVRTSGAAAPPSNGKAPSSADDGALPMAKLSILPGQIDDKDFTADVEFRYNPTRLSLKRQQKHGKDDGPYLLNPDQMLAMSGSVTIGLGKCIFVGDDVLTIAKRLWRWMEPIADKSADGKQQSGDMNEQADPPVLKFQFGTAKDSYFYVTLSTVNVDFTRFTRVGVPIRAEITIDTKQWTKELPKQNPTSGGPGGGRVHPVTAGENLQRIAMATYGSPSAWRDIAEANQIDDPLRVRPGEALYLPGV